MLFSIFCKRRVVEAFAFAWLIGEIVFLTIPIGNPYLVARLELSSLPDIDPERYALLCPGVWGRFASIVQLADRLVGIG